MPTLAARNSPANIAMTTISNTSLEVATAATTTTLSTPQTTTLHSNVVAAATCTFSAAAATNNDFLYQQPPQQTLQQQQHQQHNQHYYHHPPPPHPVATTNSQQQIQPPYDVTPAATSLATFNGNSYLNIPNGNIASSNGNGNVMSATAANACNKSETSSNAGSIIGVGNNSNSTTAVPNTVALKKATSANALQIAASREDITSLGGASSVNSQMSATLNNNNNSSNNNSISNGGASNSILKGSKENLLQNYYNGLGPPPSVGSESGAGNRHIENDDPGDGLGPLPSKWETAYTERGELYFIDHNTGTSHWLDPRLSKFQKKSLEDCGDDELPYGWEKIEDSLYGTYYIDHVNRRTQYENPVLEAKRRAAEQNQQQKQQQQLQRPQTPSSQTAGLLNGGARLGINSSTPPHLNTDISQRGMQPPPPPPVTQNPHTHSIHGAGTANSSPKALLAYKFTRNPAEMQGERITTTLLKSARGLGITIVGGDDGAEEFLQIKSIVPNGPAWLDGQLLTGDILVYVNDTCVLGFTHHEMVNVFQSILPGETVTLEVCRGYALPFDPNDPNTEVVTTIAVDGITSEQEKQRRLLMDLNMDGNYNFLDISGESNEAKQFASATQTDGGFILMKKPELHTFTIVKGAMGFGFTIADSAYGQKVKKILDRNCCTQLQESDILLEINELGVSQKSHVEVVQILKDCSKTEPTTVKIQRSAQRSSASAAFTATSNGAGNVSKLRKNFIGTAGLFRSKTPTADLYSTQQKEILPIRPKTPLVDTRRARVKTPNNELSSNDAEVAAATTNGSNANLERSLAESKLQVDAKSTNSLQEIEAINRDIPFMDPYPKLVTSLSERLAEATLMSDALTGAGVGGGQGTAHTGLTYQVPNSRANYENQEYVTASNHSGSYNPIYGLTSMPPTMSPLNPVGAAQHLTPSSNTAQQLYAPPVGTSLSLLQPAVMPTYHHENCYCYECQDYRGNKYRHAQQQHSALNYYGQPNSSTLTPLSHHHPQYSPATLHATTPLQAAHIQNERMQKRVNELLSDRRKVGFSPLESQQHTHHTLGGASGVYLPPLQHHQQQHSPAVSSISQQLPGAWNGAAGYTTLQPTNSSYGLPGGATNMRNGVGSGGGLDVADDADHFELSEVTLERQALGFGFRIVGGTEEGSQVTVGHIVPGGAADNDHRITMSDEILSIDGINVVNSSHHKVVSLMGEAALRGQVTMILRRRTQRAHPPQMSLHHMHQQHLQQQQQHQQLPLRAAPASLRYPYDVIVSRHENEGFGFVIISSSNQYYGSTIGKLIPGSPADRCGELKVGDRIIAVNRIDIAGMSHGDVVNLIKESGLHVRLTIGCPKEGGIGSGVNGSGNTLIINSAQASPGQVSQTQTQQTLQTHGNETTHAYFERPSTSAAAAAAGISQQQQHHQQQLPQL